MPGRRRRAHPAVRTTAVLLLPVLILVAVEAAGVAIVAGASADARALRDHGDYAQAVAEYEAVAARGGPVYLAAGARIDESRLQAEQTLLAWARSLAAAGHIDEALEMTSRVTDPALADTARRQRAGIGLDDAHRQSAQGRPDLALSRLDDVVAGDPPPDLAASADQLRPLYALGAARLLASAGHAQSAVAALDDVVALARGTDGAVEAQQLLPQALLDGAVQALAAHDQATALADLSRLTAAFAATPQAATARTLLKAPQRVIGTLVHRDGSAAAAVKVRLGSNYRRAGGAFTTSAPYYYARSDQHGDFAFDSVPVGAALTFEFIDQGSWTVLETDGATPALRHPVYEVTVTPLTPVDLAFVRLP